MYEFDLYARSLVRQYVKEHFENTNDSAYYDIYELHKFESGQWWKWIFATTLSDDMRYEVTYNGLEQKFNLQVYKRLENEDISLKDICGEDD